MRNLWFFFFVGLATGFIREKVFVSSLSPTADDLYIEGLASGDSPVDDEGDDDGSGSGSGDYAFSDEEQQITGLLNFTWTALEENLPVQPQPTDSAHKPATTEAGRQDSTPSAEEQDNSFPWDGRDEDDLIPVTDTTVPTATETPFIDATEYLPKSKNVEEEIQNRVDNGKSSAEGERHGRKFKVDSAKEVTSENLWERTDVLAAVIACGVVGFLCAVFLLLLLAYRMKKKDEGSYDLGDIKLSATAYHKAPTKEFYA
ncbi:syndecan-2-B [Nothobranchius furzeri]|uniref:Syndecan n=1 Tax=Nothobranchius furzeri TaxID=105023 RepID=A0A1A8USA2_NOTFU|nr:syndecan-2 [Nothobranchius furzeri]